MRFIVSAALLAFAAVAPAWADEPSGPSFDCAKASSRAEKEICANPDLAWHDRQMAKSYKVALAAVGAAGETALKAGQKAFLKARDACPAGDDLYACIAGAYAGRMAELVALVDADDFQAGNYDSGNGSLALVRYPDSTAALSILTVGGNDHTCTFETDSAAIARSGVITWSRNPDPGFYEEKCTLTLTPAGDSISLVSDGASCTYFCGMRAVLDGEYAPVAR